MGLMGGGGWDREREGVTGWAWGVGEGVVERAGVGRWARAACRWGVGVFGRECAGLPDGVVRRGDGGWDSAGGVGGGVLVPIFGSGWRAELWWLRGNGADRSHRGAVGESGWETTGMWLGVRRPAVWFRARKGRCRCIVCFESDGGEVWEGQKGLRCVFVDLGGARDKVPGVVLRGGSGLAEVYGGGAAAVWCAGGGGGGFGVGVGMRRGSALGLCLFAVLMGGVADGIGGGSVDPGVCRRRCDLRRERGRVGEAGGLGMCFGGEG